MLKLPIAWVSATWMIIQGSMAYWDSTSFQVVNLSSFWTPWRFIRRVTDDVPPACHHLHLWSSADLKQNGEKCSISLPLLRDQVTGVAERRLDYSKSPLSS